MQSLKGITTIKDFEGIPRTFAMFCDQEYKPYEGNPIGVAYCPDGMVGTELESVLALAYMITSKTKLKLGEKLSEGYITISYDELESVKKEADIAFQCTNKLHTTIPNFVYVYGYIRDGDNAYLIMENIEYECGNEKCQILSLQDIPQEEKNSAQAQIFSALSLSYKTCGLLYEEIRPENIKVKKYSTPQDIPIFLGFTLNKEQEVKEIEEFTTIDVNATITIPSTIKVYISEFYLATLNNKKDRNGLRNIADYVLTLFPETRRASPRTSRMTPRTERTNRVFTQCNSCKSKGTYIGGSPGIQSASKGRDNMEAQAMFKIIQAYPFDTIKEHLEDWKEYENTEEYLESSGVFLTELPEKLSQPNKHYAISALQRVLENLDSTQIIHETLEEKGLGGLPQKTCEKLEAMLEKVSKKLDQLCEK